MNSRLMRVGGVMLVLAAVFLPAVLAQDADEIGGMRQPAPNTGPGTGTSLMGGGVLGRVMGGALNVSRSAAPTPSLPPGPPLMYKPAMAAAPHKPFSSTRATTSGRSSLQRSSFVIDPPPGRQPASGRIQASSPSGNATLAPGVTRSSSGADSSGTLPKPDATDMIFDGQKRVK